MSIRKFWLFAKLIQNKKLRDTLWKVHKKMALDDNYSVIKVVRAFWNFLRYEKIIKFNDVFVVNSFYPPFPGKAFEQLFGGTSHSDRDLFKNFKNGKRIAPLSCYIAITSACQYHCWHCSAANRGNTDNMSTGTVKALIKDLQDMGVAIIGFTGGEPLLREDLAEIISSIDDRSVSFVFSTGYGLTRKKALDLKKAGLFGFAVSLDHYNPSIHDRKRGYIGAFDKATEAIKTSIEAGLFTMLQVVATKELLKGKDIWKIIDLGKAFGVHEIRILEPMKSGRLIGADPNIFFTEDERNQLISIHKKANKLRGYPLVTTFAHFENEEQFGCSAGVHHSYIDTSGNLCPCDFIPLSFGNIKEENIKILWKRMNRAMGQQPRCRCFMQENADKIKEASNGILPLNPEISKKICQECRPGQLPKFFQLMKGGD